MATKRVIFPSLRREQGRYKEKRYFPIRGPPGDCILRHPLPTDFFLSATGKQWRRIENKNVLNFLRRGKIGKVSRGFSRAMARLRITNRFLRDVFSKISKDKRRFITLRKNNSSKRSKLSRDTRQLRLSTSKRRTRKTKIHGFVYIDTKRVRGKSVYVYFLIYYEIYSVRLTPFKEKRILIVY